MDPARVVEFSCGECAGVAGRGHQLPLQDPGVAVCLLCRFVSTLEQRGIFRGSEGVLGPFRSERCLLLYTQVKLFS